jgi:hypothetical protein
MQDPHSEFGELTIFDELAQMRKSFIFRFGDKFDEVKHAFHNRTFEVVATLVTKDA